MSTTVDANLLLYASNRKSEHHRQALSTVRSLAEGSAILYLFWPVTMAYLRIATHQGVFEDPLSPDKAVGNIRSLSEHSHVRTPGEGEGFWRYFSEVTENMVVRGNLVPDAHLVALMRQYGVSKIVSHDRDFNKFRDIKVIDPFR